MENYDAYRGRELITFSDYCVFESLVQKHINILQTPAVDTVKIVRGTVTVNYRYYRESIDNTYHT